MKFDYGMNHAESKMSVKEFRNYLLKHNSKAHYDFDIMSSDLYRARWTIRQFIREYELYIGKRVHYAYIEALDLWKVFV